MKIFIDSANFDEIQSLHKVFNLDGVTTNPSLLAGFGFNNAALKANLHAICNLFGEQKKPVSIEVKSHSSVDDMIKEANFILKEFNKHGNVCIKLPITDLGLECCRILSNQNIKTNMTLCFSLPQAILVAKAGATFVSPFIGRLEDNGQDGLSLIRDIKNVYNNYSFKTEILSASVRNIKHFEEVSKIGSDCITMSSKIIKELIQHDLTTTGLAKFIEDGKKYSINSDNI